MTERLPCTCKRRRNGLYLAAGSSVFSIRAFQADEKFIVLNGVTPLVTGVWYNIVAASDGNVLSLYLFDNRLGKYRIEGSTPFHGQLFTGDRYWLVGQGASCSHMADQTFGLIDEVRISDKALKPYEFLFAPKMGTAPSETTK